MQAEESGAAQPPGAAPRHVQAGDETYVISDARWTRIFPDAAAASGDEPTPAPRRGSALPLIVVGAGAVLAGAGALVWWVTLAQRQSAPTPRPAPAPIVAAPVAPTPIAPVPTAAAIPLSPPQPRASSVVPAARPHHRAAVAPMDRDGAAGAHEAAAASPDATPPEPPPAAKKGNAISRFFGHLFGGRHASANATSSGGEKADPSP